MPRYDDQQRDFVDDQDRADARALAEERRGQEASAAAAVKASHDEWAKRANLEAIEREFKAAGVEPPTKPDGTPNLTCGLSLLLHLGWRIADVEGKRALVAPPRPAAWTGHRDRDSLPEENPS